MNNLFVLPQYTECLRKAYAALRVFNRDPDAWTKSFPVTLQTIYNDLLDQGAPTTIIKNKNTVTKPKINLLQVPEDPSVLSIEVEASHQDTPLQRLFL